MLVFACAPPLFAQYEDEDEQTGDYSEQDRAYYERYADQPAETADPDDDGAASLAAFLSRAEELIRDRSYSAGDSPHYRVQTDDPRLRPDATARLLESFRSFFDSYWPADLDLLPYDETSRVFLFYSFYKFNEMTEGNFRRSDSRPKGHYGSTYDVITLHTDAGDAGSLADTIVHEAAHQLVTQRILGGEISPSPWLNEGIASYFGFTRADENGEFEAGSIGGKPVSLFTRPVKQSAAERKRGIDVVRDALREARSEGELLVAGLVSIRDPAVYYGERAALNYAASWLLVHYLLHGDDGGHAAAFRRVLNAERERQGGTEVLYRELELTPQQLEASFAAHVKKLKTR